VALMAASGWVVGVMGSLFRSGSRSAPMEASSSAVRDSEESSVSPTKPRPGVNALCVTAGWVCSSLRRQDRARTPDRRIAVPRAIRPA
jgi:hypothetical protein